MRHILLLASVAMLSACTSKQATEAPATKSLVLYYSQTQTTQQVAQLLQQKVGADIDSIVVEQPYDGSFQETIARCQQEFAEGTVPAIKPLSKDVACYDTIYLGYPVWFGTYAQPVLGLLKSVDLSGKVIIPFCTFGSGGLNTSSDNLKTAVPDACFLPGYGVRSARIAAASAELDEFLIRLGVKAGEVASLPEFSEQKPLSADEQQIFDAACGSYPMPLGIPVTVASRAIQSGTEYEFVTESQSANGQTATARIYVTVCSAEGSTPEFTQVVR